MSDERVLSEKKSMLGVVAYKVLGGLRAGGEGRGAWAMRSVTGLVQRAEPGRQLKSVSLGESPKQYSFIK